MSGSSGRPKISVSIRVRYNSAAAAKAILKATLPDNFKASQETIIESKLDGSEIQFNISSVRGIGSLILTVDDLLSCMQVAERSISGIN